MKKLSFIALFLVVVMLACCFTACDSLWYDQEKTDVTTEQQKTESSKTENESTNQQESEKAEAPITPPTLDTDDERVDFVREEIAVTLHDPTQFYIPHQVNKVECVDSFTDGAYNYYYFYLGYLENFPLLYSTTIKHTGIEQTYQRTLSAESESSIGQAVSNSVTVTNSSYWENELGWEVDTKIGNDLASVSIKRSYKGSWGEEHSQSTATETTHSVANTWAESSADQFVLPLTSTDPLGEYRYVHYTKKCFVYVVAVYSLSSKEFVGYDYLTFADESIKNSVVMIEYSTDGIFSSDNDSNLKFDPALINNIDVSIELENRSPSIGTDKATPIDVAVQKHLCELDKNYDLETNGVGRDGETDHSEFELGHLTIYGCEKRGENIYIIKEPENFAIEYIFEEDTKELPNKYNHELRVSDDGATLVKGTSIQGKKIGQGAYQIKITRKSGASDDPIVVHNFMEGKYATAIERMLKAGNIANPETIAKIEITIVYELYYYHSWFDQHHTNWRSDYVFYFQ